MPDGGPISGDTQHTLPVIISGPDNASARKAAAHQLAPLVVVPVSASGIGSSSDAARALMVGGVLHTIDSSATGGPEFVWGPAFPVKVDDKGDLRALDGEGGIDKDIDPFV